MLHPVGPPQRRTVAMRRRQALFFFVWGVLLVTVFLLPYHCSSLRRLRLEGARRVRGDSAPEMDVAQLKQRQKSALVRLTKQLTARVNNNVRTAADHDHDVGNAAARTAADFATVFYYHPSTEVRLSGMFDHPELRKLAGAGGGRLWRRLGGGTPSTAQRWTVAEATSAGNGTGSRICVVALHRHYLAARLSNAVHGDGDAELIDTLRVAVRSVNRLSPVTVSTDNAAVAGANVGVPSMESTLARFFLWLADDAVLGDEAVSRAVAGCAAPLFRSLRASFDWRASPAGKPARTELEANLLEVEERQPQYVCLCSGRKPASAVALRDTDGSSASPLFLLHPQQFTVKPHPTTRLPHVAVQHHRLLRLLCQRHREERHFAETPAGP